MRTFLPPQVQDLFPPLHPDKGHLQALEGNLFFREYLGRVLGVILVQQRHLAGDKTHEEFYQKVFGRPYHKPIHPPQGGLADPIRYLQEEYRYEGEEYPSSLWYSNMVE